MCERSRLMQEIGILCFVTVELGLYLDTHPDDCAALEDYNCYADQLAQLKAMYAENFGPLENFGNCINHGTWHDWDFCGYMFQGKNTRITESKPCRTCAKEV